MTERYFVSGTPVCDANGEHLGDVGEHHTVDGYLDVMKGTFWQTNVYIPVDFIGRDDDNGVYLTITKDAVARHDWAQPSGAVRKDGN